MSFPSLSALGLLEEEYVVCQLLRVHDQRMFVKNAVHRLGGEVPDFRKDEITATIASKIAEFIVWYVVLDGIKKFDEKYVCNTQSYEWLSPASVPGIDIYGATRIDNQWIFAVVEIKWSEKCDFRQITSPSKGLVHDLQKLFEGDPSNRLTSRLSSLRCQLRRYQECSDALLGLRQVMVGPDPTKTVGVQFVGFFVGDTALAADKRGYIKAFDTFRSKAINAGWRDEDLETYMITGTPLFEMFDAIARGDG